MSANLENSAVATGLEKVNPHPNSQESSIKDCANHQTVALISHEVMLKILHVRFSIMWTKSFQMSTLDLEKEEEPEIKLPTFSGS